MKRTIVFVITMLFFVVLVYASGKIALPDYKNEAQLISKVFVCDGGATRYYHYRKDVNGDYHEDEDEYTVLVTETPRKNFYWWSDGNTGSVHLFIENGSTLIEVTEKEWYKKRATSAPNLINAFNGKPSDCSRNE